MSSAFLVPPKELRAPTRRDAQTARARQVAMYLAHVGFGLTYSEAGLLFGRDRTTVAHACRLVEDRRNDPGFDVSLDCLEQTLRARVDGIFGAVAA
ncbi:MAG: helix-turn-helix domain-containing protein [Hyphomicrobiales bacterium]|nr:helix-turn-helix domain-containing protein [Hyphomicrobiales bacterium]